MAIFYRWLKGYNDVSGQESVPGVYSFLQWPTKNDFDADGNSEFISEEDISPKFYLTTDSTNTSSTASYVGRVLLDREIKIEKLYCQNIHLPWLFKNGAGIGCNLIQYIDNTDKSITASNKKGATVSLLASGIEIAAPKSGTGTETGTPEILASITNTEIAFNKPVSITGGLSVTEDIAGNNLNITGTITGSNANITGTITGATIKSTGLCEAEYFNATSDLRAKTNIETADFSEEFIDDILAAILTYEFKNKPSTNTRFIGLIAQEVIAICVEHNVDPRIFVSNVEATGVDDDYMSLNVNNLMFLFAQGLKYTRNKQQNLEHRLRQLEVKLNG